MNLTIDYASRNYRDIQLENKELKASVQNLCLQLTNAENRINFLTDKLNSSSPQRGPNFLVSNKMQNRLEDLEIQLAEAKDELIIEQEARAEAHESAMRREMQLQAKIEEQVNVMNQLQKDSQNARTEIENFEQRMIAVDSQLKSENETARIEEQELQSCRIEIQGLNEVVFDLRNQLELYKNDVAYLQKENEIKNNQLRSEFGKLQDVLRRNDELRHSLNTSPRGYR